MFFLENHMHDINKELPYCDASQLDFVKYKENYILIY